MGVPRFFGWLARRFPLIVQPCERSGLTECDNLYLDMNGIIHNAIRSGDSNLIEMGDEEFHKNVMYKIFSYVEVVFNMVKPRKYLYLGVDGCAPVAKIAQQRQRRYRSVFERKLELEKLKDKCLEEGIPFDESKEYFDTNCISPGTEIMQKVDEAFKYFIEKKITYDQDWRKCTVVYSGHNVPGEGEHKILNFIRNRKSGMFGDMVKNETHCVYGLDADLIFLGLLTHEPYLFILREMREERKAKKQIIPEFEIIQLSILRDYLEQEFQGGGRLEYTKYPFEIERIIDDFVLVCFLMGNDFLPHIPSLDIYEGALDLIIDIYKRTVPLFDGYLTEGGEIDFSRLKRFLESLKDVEFSLFESNVQFRRKKETLKKKEEEKEEVEGEEEVKTEVEQEETKEEEAKVEEEEEDDGVKMRKDFMKWRRNYYQKKLKILVDEENVDKDDENEKLNEVRRKFIEGVRWTFYYYCHGIRNWKWYYPYHYSPLLLDLAKNCELYGKSSDPLFEKSQLGVPFSPFEQLLAILPPSSSNFLPKVYNDLFHSSDSPMKRFYKELTHDDVDRDSDLGFSNVKKPIWQAVVKIPFIEEKVLKKSLEEFITLEKIKSSLTEEENIRNTERIETIYKFDGGKKKVVEIPEWLSVDSETKSMFESKVVSEDFHASVLPKKYHALPFEGTDMPGMGGLLGFGSFQFLENETYRLDYESPRVTVGDNRDMVSVVHFTVRPKEEVVETTESLPPKEEEEEEQASKPEVETPKTDSPEEEKEEVKEEEKSKPEPQEERSTAPPPEVNEKEEDENEDPQLLSNIRKILSTKTVFIPLPFPRLGEITRIVTYKGIYEFDHVTNELISTRHENEQRTLSTLQNEMEYIRHVLLLHYGIRIECEGKESLPSLYSSSLCYVRLYEEPRTDILQRKIVRVLSSEERTFPLSLVRAFDEEYKNQVLTPTILTELQYPPLFQFQKNDDVGVALEVLAARNEKLKHEDFEGMKLINFFRKNRCHNEMCGVLHVAAQESEPKKEEEEEEEEEGEEEEEEAVEKKKVVEEEYIQIRNTVDLKEQKLSFSVPDEVKNEMGTNYSALRDGKNKVMISCGVNRYKTLRYIIGSFFIRIGEEKGDDTKIIDIGLDLMNKRRRLVRPGFSRFTYEVMDYDYAYFQNFKTSIPRRKNNNMFGMSEEQLYWLSQPSIHIILGFRSRFPEIFDFFESGMNDMKIKFGDYHIEWSDLYPKSTDFGETEVSKIREWIQSQDHYSVGQVDVHLTTLPNDTFCSIETQLMDPEKNVEEEPGKTISLSTKFNSEEVGNYLWFPDYEPYPPVESKFTTRMFLGSEVVLVKSSHSPFLPFGSRGVVVSRTTRKFIKVMFAKEFFGGVKEKGKGMKSYRTKILHRDDVISVSPYFYCWKLPLTRIFPPYGVWMWLGVPNDGMTENRLKSVFSRVDPRINIKKCILPMGKRYGFIQFDGKEAADLVIEHGLVTGERAYGYKFMSHLEYYKSENMFGEGAEEREKQRLQRQEAEEKKAMGAPQSGFRGRGGSGRGGYVTQRGRGRGRGGGWMARGRGRGRGRGQGPQQMFHHGYGYVPHHHHHHHQGRGQFTPPPPPPQQQQMQMQAPPQYFPHPQQQFTQQYVTVGRGAPVGRGRGGGSPGGQRRYYTPGYGGGRGGM